MVKYYPDRDWIVRLQDGKVVGWTWKGNLRASHSKWQTGVVDLGIIQRTLDRDDDKAYGDKVYRASAQGEELERIIDLCISAGLDVT